VWPSGINIPSRPQVPSIPASYASANTTATWQRHFISRLFILSICWLHPMKSWVLNAIGAQVPDQTNTSSKCDDAFQSYYIIFTWLLQVWKPHPAAMPSKNRQMKLNDILREIICRSICMIDPSKQYYWHVAVVPLVATAKMPPELSVRTRKGKTHLNSKRLTSCNGNQHFLTVVWLTRSQTTRQVTDRPWLPVGPKDQASK
jgi:hypothetical protein